MGTGIDIACEVSKEHRVYELYHLTISEEAFVPYPLAGVEFQPDIYLIQEYVWHCSALVLFGSGKVLPSQTLSLEVPLRMSRCWG